MTALGTHRMSTDTGFVLWFTGLSGSGKSTLAGAVAPRLRALGHRVELLDGDEVRASLCRGLGFSREDRDTNIGRIGYVAGKLAHHGVAVLVAAISPYREARDLVRGSVDHFVEVFVAAPLETCVRRDVKGLYASALAGRIASFTGVSDPYEPPLHPELTLRTHCEAVERSAERVLLRLSELGLTARRPDPPAVTTSPLDGAAAGALGSTSQLTEAGDTACHGGRTDRA
jgi:adenylylsulfate kinase